MALASCSAHTLVRREVQLTSTFLINPPEMETSRSQFPGKEQAIVLTSIKDLKLTDYVVAIGDNRHTKECYFCFSYV